MKKTEGGDDDDDDDNEQQINNQQQFLFVCLFVLRKRNLFPASDFCSIVRVSSRLL